MDCCRGQSLTVPRVLISSTEWTLVIGSKSRSTGMRSLAKEFPGDLVLPAQISGQMYLLREGSVERILESAFPVQKLVRSAGTSNNRFERSRGHVFGGQGGSG